MTSPGDPIARGSATPLFRALNADRYERQRLIREYEEQYDCRLIVMIDAIFPYSITLFEELLYDAEKLSDLHLLLSSPGGDGETAIRLVRAAQSSCHDLTVIVPDQAKSAATLIALGAHHILMGFSSDLGPIDPQFQLTADGPLTAAKDIIAAVEHATSEVKKAPDTYPIHASLLSDVNAIMVQQAKAELDRTDALLLEALRAHPERTDQETGELQNALTEPLIKVETHSALFGLREAQAAKLPVRAMERGDPQWDALWGLWAKYYALGTPAYEGRRASQIGRTS